MKEYLFYVYKQSIFDDIDFNVYRCKTQDPFHTMGEMQYRMLEQIERISFVDCTEEKLELWKNQGVYIHNWNDIYSLDYKY